MSNAHPLPVVALARCRGDLGGGVRLLLTCASASGSLFEPAWELASEAALSYMSDREAAHWWDVLDGTRDAWRAADVRQGSRLDALRR